MYRNRVRNELKWVANIHPTAYVSRDATIELGVVIEAHACVYADVHLGAGTVIRNGAVIGTGTKIGEQCEIGASAHIGANSVIGKHVRVIGLSELRRNTHIEDGEIIRTPSIFSRVAGGSRKS